MLYVIVKDKKWGGYLGAQVPPPQGKPGTNFKVVQDINEARHFQVIIDGYGNLSFDVPLATLPDPTEYELIPVVALLSNVPGTLAPLDTPDGPPTDGD